MRKILRSISVTGFLAALLPVFTEAQSINISLDSWFRERGKAVSHLVYVAGDHSSCELALFAAPSKRALKRQSGGSVQLGTASASANSFLFEASNLRTYTLPRRSSPRRVFFQVQATCDQASGRSNIKRLKLKPVKRGGLRTIGGWLSDLQSKTTSRYLALAEAFDGIQFTQLTGLYNAGDGSGRIFVLEKQGQIWVIKNSSGSYTRTSFLNLSVSSNSEQGLLGLAFHPNFQSNGYVYIHYTAPGTGASRVSRFSVDPSNPDALLADSELIILEVAQPAQNHNGGEIAFGPDGYLYISLGDGGGSGDQFENSQNPGTLLGAILRIDVDQSGGGLNYGVPQSNPLQRNSKGFRKEIFAWGLRNVWRFSFDPVTGLIWAGDVGQNQIEEIDIIKKGKNYGWPIREGRECYNSRGCKRRGLTPPIYEYPRRDGSSVTGGYVFRGDSIPGLNGAYIYGDFIDGNIWALRKVRSRAVNSVIGKTDLLISSFGLDEAGDLYILDFGSGKIFKLTAPSA